MIITKTPLRISFVGGGTDLAAYYKSGHGAVVSAAIDKFVYITINKRFDDSIRLSYSRTETVAAVDELRHDIVRACMHLTGVTSGVEITSIADIPSGTGLGSSSSFTVGLLNALYSYKGEQLSARELAEQACQVEIDILRHPIGKQDQYAAAYGGLNYFSFNKDGSVDRQKIALSTGNLRQMDEELLMFYTGIRRSADGILKQQQADTGKKLATLDYMRNQADSLYAAFSQTGFDDSFGTLLHEAWLKKKTVTGGITSPQIDGSYAAARAAGALGGKILGAGGGGFWLFHCKQPQQKAVRQALGLRELDFSLYPYGSRVVFFA